VYKISPDMFIQWWIFYKEKKEGRITKTQIMEEK
jgi:hypothetical protein